MYRQTSQDTGAAGGTTTHWKQNIFLSFILQFSSVLQRYGYLSLCSRSQSSVPTLLYSPLGKINLKSHSKVKVLNLRCQKVDQYCKYDPKDWFQDINNPLNPLAGPKFKCFQSEKVFGSPKEFVIGFKLFFNQKSIFWTLL